MRAPFGVILLTLLFAVLALADLVQLGQAVRGVHPDPISLLLAHGITAVLAAAAAVGAWRLRAWAPGVVLLWGVVTAAMLIALGPLLDTPATERRSLWIAAGVVMAFAALAGVYLRRHRGRTAA